MRAIAPASSTSLLLLLLLGGAGCSEPINVGEGEGEGAEGEGEGGVVRLEISPESLEMVIGESQVLTVVGREADGDEVNVSNSLSFESSATNVASVDDTGNVSAVGAGEARITAAVGDVTIEVPVLVTAPTPPTELIYDDLALAVGEDVTSTPTTDARGATFTIVPDLPAGLTLNATTGQITGRVDVAFSSSSFAVTAENDAGAITAGFLLSVTCDPAIAVPPRDGDLPDVDGVDQNDDGIDGLACGPLFVSPTGSDDTGTGTLELPFATVGRALLIAAEEPGRDLYIAAGTYNASIALQQNVSVYGGYDPATWERSALNITTLTGTNPVITGELLEGSITLQRLRVEAEDGFFGGERSTAISLVDAGTVFLEDVRVQAGRGADGADGEEGLDAFVGGDGIDGGAGCEDGGLGCDACAEPVGGEGAFSFGINGNGGDGGAPGFGAGPGVDGDEGEGGAPGGVRGFGDPATGVTRDGDPGFPGSDGPDGDDGAGGAADADGADGEEGVDGEGGGGGGGGAGANNFLCDEFGAAGGGGGAGARTGLPGLGGQAGGASVGVFASGTTTLSLVGAVVLGGTGGDGGDGGRGGDGADGGVGGDGGLAIASTSDERGGNGGKGGDGGRAGSCGHGGGGGGGSSIALVVADGAVVDVDDASELITGSAGRGGAGPGNAGQAGNVLDRDDQ